MVDKQLEELLQLDGLAEAERITGKSYKEDEATMALGFVHHTTIVQRTREALEAVDAAVFSNDLDRYLRIASEEGFEVVLAEPFEGSYGTDTFYVLWNDADAILLGFDTYGDHVNGGKFYYNVKPNDEYLPWQSTSSGGYTDGIWIGDHDCREALRFNIARLRENGTFVKPWIGSKFGVTHLLNYQEWENAPKDASYDEKSAYYDRIGTERLSRLPAHVREVIGCASSSNGGDN